MSGPTIFGSLVLGVPCSKDLISASSVAALSL
jgi:hypothetical protein